MRADCMPVPWPPSFEPVSCPFCKEDDFDIYGLQAHLSTGWCPNFGKYDSRNQLATEGGDGR